MGSKLRLCYQCRDYYEDAYELRSISLEEYTSGGTKLRDRCDHCKAKGKAMACYEIVRVKRRTT